MATKQALAENQTRNNKDQSVTCLRPDKIRYDSRQQARLAAQEATRHYDVLIECYPCTDHYHLSNQTQNYSNPRVKTWRMEITESGAVLKRT